MKKLLTKLWAKIAAFLLFFPLLALTVAGGIGIFGLVVENAFIDGGAQMREEALQNLCYQVVASRFYDFPRLTAEEMPDIMAWLDDSDCAVIVYDADGQEIGRAGDMSSTVYRTTLEIYDGYDASTRITVEAGLKQNYVGTYESHLVLWLAGHAALTVFLTLLAAALTCFLLVFSLWSAAHWAGHEELWLVWPERVPMDLLLFAVLLLNIWMADEFIPYNNWVGMLLMIPLDYLALLFFTAQCKTGEIFRRSLIVRVLRLLRKGLRLLGQLLGRLPLVWRTVLTAAALLVPEVFFLFCWADAYEEEFLVVWILYTLLLLCAVTWLGLNLRALQTAGQALARGDYDYQVDTRKLFGPFRAHGEALNSARQGVRAAVETQMKSERLKTELITNVSHDIKTPLTSIVNYVDLLKKENIPGETAQSYLEVLDRQSQRLRKLTEDLVEASKAATGNIPVELSATDLNVFLSQVAGEYEPRLREKELQPVLLLHDAALFVMADGALLWRVLDNLLSNACKYAMPGTRVYLSTADNGGEGVITVKNVSRCALQVSPAELTERFVRGDASRSTEGSGLGLSIAQSLTELQGGRFELNVDGDLFKVRLLLPKA